MAHDCEVAQRMLAAQARVFRVAERDFALTLKAISLDTGIPYNTVRSYAGHNGAPTMMPVSALAKLMGVIPDTLLSHLFDPVGKAIVDCTSDDGDHDTLGIDCGNIVGLVSRARHPNSPAGVDISDCEDKVIRLARAQLRARA